MEENTKVCSKCLASLPENLNFFRRHKKGKNGLSAECIACLRLRSKAYQRANEEKMYQANIRYRLDHPEWLKERKRAYYLKHREEVKKKAAEYRTEAPLRNDRIEKASKANKRAKYLGLTDTITPNEIQAKYDAQHGKCYWCAVDLNYSYHLDHMLPFCKGGSNHIDNICVTCCSCNMKKGKKHPYDWINSTIQRTQRADGILPDDLSAGR